MIIDAQERLAPHIHDMDRVLDRITRLAKVARALELPVTITEQYVRGLGPTVAPVLAAFTDAPRLEKQTFSAWDDNATHERLLLLRRPQMLIAGVEAHVCVQQTASDMWAAGMEPVILADAVSSRRPLDCEVGLARMRARGIDVTTLEAVTFEMLRRADGEAFRAALPALK